MGWVFEYLIEELTDAVLSQIKALADITGKDSKQIRTKFDDKTCRRTEYGEGEPNEGQFIGTATTEFERLRPKMFDFVIEYNIKASLARDPITGPYIDYHVEDVKITNFQKWIDSLTMGEIAEAIARKR